jgi:hypothetical protein
MSESRVWIAQCLCPDRHCIIGEIGLAESDAEAETNVRAPLRRKVVELLKSGEINPWCAICDANRATWRYEVRRTAFGSVEEAIPKLRETEAKNALTNLIYGDLHRNTKPN